MRESEVRRAMAAATSIASSLGLPAGDAVVLHDSNKLTLRLLPADVLARVAPVADQVAEFEVGLAQRLAGAGCPVGTLDPRVEPRVQERDGFAVTLWTYYAPVAPGELAPADYARALVRLHTGMRELDVPAPRFTERVARAERLVADRDRTPGAGQLLHGEPHPGNVLPTENGPLFIDLETCCRGPVEFDLAHTPEEVGAHYPGVDRELLRQCRLLVLALITVWRWDRDDRFPEGRRLGTEWLGLLRAALGDHGPGTQG
ncbi:phosphotransferase family protein [Streptomyces sp. NPDC058374]|uniref:phosphotransferase family protein n=1 Tax=Streptomyces sp. NPDC058374 TaxID=3346466 RepID=UPI00365F7E39